MFEITLNPVFTFYVETRTSLGTAPTELRNAVAAVVAAAAAAG